MLATRVGAQPRQVDQHVLTLLRSQVDQLLDEHVGQAELCLISRETFPATHSTCQLAGPFVDTLEIDPELVAHRVEGVRTPGAAGCHLAHLLDDLATSLADQPGGLVEPVSTIDHSGGPSVLGKHHAPVRRLLVQPQR